MYLSNEQREIGTRNFLTVLGSVRREFLEKSLQADSIGRYYFGYGKMTGGPVRAGIIGTGNEGCAAMIQQSSPEYLRYVAFHDIRPTQIERAKNLFKRAYGDKEGSAVKAHDSYESMLNDPNIEAIVIATPLWLHAKQANEAMKRGKHVLCEKLMAYDITQAKSMIRTADETKRILSIGHQRHYSTIYDNVLAVLHSGVLGDIRHIRAHWHRNNTWKDPNGVLHDGWTPKIDPKDETVDFRKYGYSSIKELIRWRLYRRTGGGLMAELGSHQLDACSLFLNKAHPLAVQGVGGKHYFDDDRECEDHVYCDYDMPGGVTVSYSSINTNRLFRYGEMVFGTKGTLMVLDEQDVYLFKEREPSDKKPAEEIPVRVDMADGKPKMVGIETATISAEAALAKSALDRASKFIPLGDKSLQLNRGYRDEIEAFAHAVRNPSSTIRCTGRVALADAVMALTANIAFRTREKIHFKPTWYDPASSDAPDAT